MAKTKTMRIKTLEKLITLEKMILKAESRRDQAIIELRNAPNWWATELIIHFENRIYINNEIIARLEGYYLQNLHKLQSL